MTTLDKKAYKCLSRWAAKQLKLQSELIPTVIKKGRYNINENTQVALFYNSKKIDTCKMVLGLDY